MKTGPSPATVETVWERAEGSCEKCGRSLQRSQRGLTWSVHHRVARGMGSSKLAWMNLPGNLVAICGSGVTGCHGAIESDRTHSYDTGWLVRRHGRDLPATIPLEHYRHGFVFLDDNGTTTPA